MMSAGTPSDIPPHAPDWQVEVRKETAGLPEAQGRGQRQIGKKLVSQSLGKEGPFGIKGETLAFSFKYLKCDWHFLKENTGEMGEASALTKQKPACLSGQSLKGHS